MSSENMIAIIYGKIFYKLMNKNILQVKKELRKIANPKRAEFLQRYFKTGKEEYGEGDVFLGITVPQCREVAEKYYDLDIKQLKLLIDSKIHEERLIALLILVYNFSRGSDPQKEKIYNCYLKNTKYINNWDLVDLSAPNIVGEHLFNLSFGSAQDTNFPILIRLAKSENLWERRIAVLATFYFIKNNKFDESLELAEILLNDPHDLIHKAVGWMLREVGKRDLKTEIEFLNKHCQKMPRTMLRYAIEKFPEKLRKTYLKRRD